MDLAKNNVIVLPFALGKKQESCKLTINSLNCGGSVLENENIADTETEEVQVIKLDDISAAFSSFGEISFIKIDIQGREIDALKGAIDTIKNFKPTILCETSTSHADQSDEINNFLKKLGYVRLVKMSNDTLFAHVSSDLEFIEVKLKDYLKRLEHKKLVTQNNDKT